MNSARAKRLERISAVFLGFSIVFSMFFCLRSYTQKAVGSKHSNVLNAYLVLRRASVVQGSASEEFALEHVVFQGIVCSPILWNTFFVDVCEPAAEDGGREAIFDDDLNIFKFFD